MCIRDRLIISLETGDVRLAPMQLKTLNVALTNGGLRAENLTVTRDLLVELPAGGCMIDHLSVAEYANICLLYTSHCLHAGEHHPALDRAGGLQQPVHRDHPLEGVQHLQAGQALVEGRNDPGIFRRGPDMAGRCV